MAFSHYFPSSSSLASSMRFYLLFGFWVLLLFPQFAASVTRHYTFNIEYLNVTRLCHTRSILSVNGKFPGPRLIAREGDRVVVKVVNHVSNNVSIHWHGVRQLRSGWFDGPSYVTQCPIQTNQSFTYNFTITGQRGTLLWHAHISWLRATLYGPIIILPSRNQSYPFPKPHKEIPILLGEWFNVDPEAIISQALQTGGGPNVSDAYTINGLPGPFYNCSSKDTYKLKVKPGKTYLLRLINAALNDELFFTIANHTLTVVETDAAYVKPFKTATIVIAPGQTITALLHTKPHTSSSFLIAARPYFTGRGTLDNSTTAAILQYHPTTTNNSFTNINNLTTLPPTNGTAVTAFVANFTGKFKTLANAKFPANVPQKVDKHFFFTVGLGTSLCPKNATCQGPTNTTKFAAAVNNISFALPSVAMLQAYYTRKWEGVFKLGFPVTPENPFNYTGAAPLNNTVVGNDTRVAVVKFNESIEVVLQDTNVLGAESHPLHLHGYNFYVVGQGFGNYNENEDSKKFNLVDPVERNTASVPAGGWIVIRFLADNPGVWFMHCHLDVHTSWGLRMAWLVLDGTGPNQKLQPPPSDLPQC